jgi:hypothetical protein
VAPDGGGGVKVYHKADKINPKGQVSALCYARPRPIPLSRGQSSTFIPANVTCPKCRRILEARGDG